MRRAKWLAIGVAAMMLAGCDRGSHPGQIGVPAPLFAISDGEQSLDLAKLRGQVVVLNFWASWCGPCLEELPSMTALQHAMPRVKIVTVSTDEDPDAYHIFLTRHQVELYSIRDGEQKSNKLYGTMQYPETFIIDKTGVIRRKFIGAQDWTSPEIVDYLTKLSS